MVSINVKNKKVIGLSLTILLIVTALFIIVLNLYQIKTTSQYIHQQQLILEKKLQMGQNIKEISKQYKQILAEMDLINNIFVVKGEELEFITTLEKIASDNNLELRIDMSEPDSEDSIQLSLVLSGEYNSILLFIEKLESIPTYYNIEEITIANQGLLSEVSHLRATRLNATDIKNKIVTAKTNGYIYLLE